MAMGYVEIFAIGIMAAAILQGLGISVVSWLNPTETAIAKFLFSCLISVMSLTLLYFWVEKIEGFERYPKLLFFPIYYTYAFAPLLFFYVKASLYKDFKLDWRDLKHFLLPIAQANFFFFMSFRSTDAKINAWTNDFSLLYGTFGYPVYLLLFTLYSYFAYRFIKHRIASLKHIAHTRYDERHALRLKKMVKGLYILLLINSSFIISNFFIELFFHIALNKNLLYRFFTDLSFAAMIYWVGAYGYYRLVKANRLF